MEIDKKLTEAVTLGNVPPGIPVILDGDGPVVTTSTRIEDCIVVVRLSDGVLIGVSETYGAQYVPQLNDLLRGVPASSFRDGVIIGCTMMVAIFLLIALVI